MVDKLLRHPVPYINESIGNYVLRLCSENFCSVSQISNLIEFYNMRFVENYYRKLKEKNITNLSDLTGFDLDVIEDMTANRFCFDEKNDFSCRTEACVCPKCFSERSYERIHWKNKLIKVCLDHEIYLLDECPRCKEKITSNIIFNGRCNCGLLINDFKYSKCVNEYILRNQNILYQIFNIKSSASLEKNELLYNTISGEDYCKLLFHFQNLAMLYSDDLNDIGLFCDSDEGFISNIIASWIMIDWPVNITKFLDILNCLDIKYINRSSFEVNNELSFDAVYTDMIRDRFMRIFNPLECLKLRKGDISNIVFSYKEIYEPLMNFFYENSNKENVKLKMDKYVYLNNYVELDIAIKIFFDTTNYVDYFVKNYFHVYRFFNKEYLKLEEIFIFYNEIKKNCSASFSDIKEISYEYTKFLYDLRYFNIDLNDIIYISRKLKVRFNPMNYTGLIIYIQFNITKKELLRIIINRILDDTGSFI